MSLFEKGWSSGEVSLTSLMAGAPPKSDTIDFNLRDLARKIVLGGWPMLIDAEIEDGFRFIRDYVKLLAEIDISRVSNKKRDPLKVTRLLQSLARNISTTATITSLAEDAGGAEVAVTNETVAEYLDALERLMVYEPLPAWSTHIRSSATLRKAPKRHFADPSIAVGALGYSVEKLVGDLNAFGFIFESLAIRDLRIYAEVNDGTLYHYRDSANLEADAIVEYPDGTWAVFEVKLGSGEQEVAAKNLIALSKKIHTKKVGEPAALTVITGNGFAYRRPDGVNVVPLSTLTA
jgi:predicted AAA+ superfamily ATPase